MNTASTEKPRQIRIPRELARRPVRPSSNRRRIRMPWVRLAFMAIAGLALIGLTVDLVSLRLKADQAFQGNGESSLVSDAVIEITTATNRYEDFAGRFSIPLPASWAAYPYRNEGDYDVTLRGPHRMEICISTRRVGPGGMADVQAVIAANEARARIRTDLEQTEFLGRPAFRRVVPLRTITVEAYDFIAGPWHMHVSASAPRNAFETLRPALMEMCARLQVPEDPAEKEERARTSEPTQRASD